MLANLRVPPSRPRLGADFAKLWAANAVSNLGDGVTMAAGPLLVASMTADPALIAGAVFVQQLPWLLFALVSGAYVDRLDRRRLIVGVNVVRGTVLAVLAVAIATGTVTIPVVYAAFFLLGVGETIADTGSVALLPSIVPAAALPRANARLMATNVLGNQIAAKPFGAYLFVIAAALPFGFDAATFVVAALLVASIGRRETARPPVARSLRADIVDGLRWLWRHPTLRTLAVCVGVMNLTGAGTFALWVLLARDRLGLDPVGYGWLLTAYAIGGLLGTLVASRLEAAFGSAPILRLGLIIEGGAQLVLAVTHSPWVAAVTLVAFGAHAMVWGVIAVSLRQRIVPDPLRGRVSSVYALFNVGGAALGTLLGGLLARAWGVPAPFWVAAAAMVPLVLLAWRKLTPVP